MNITEAQNLSPSQCDGMQGWTKWQATHFQSALQELFDLLLASKHKRTTHQREINPPSTNQQYINTN